MADTGVTRRDYVNVHHLIWREAGNDIPPGHILIFRDGNKANFALENLELITRKENMRRNSVHNLPKELAELCQLKGHCSARSTQNKRQNDMTQPTIGDVRDLLFAQMKALSKPDATSETLDKSRGDGRAGADHHQPGKLELDYMKHTGQTEPGSSSASMTAKSQRKARRQQASRRLSPAERSSPDNA